MKLLTAVAVLLLCQALTWPEEVKDPFDSPITLRIGSGNWGTTTDFENQIFNMQIWYWLYVRRVDMDWALFSPGEECMDDNWWLGISAQYSEPPEGRVWFLSRNSKSPGMFVNFHHKQDLMEFHGYIPMAMIIDGQRFYPWFLLDRFKLIDIGKNTQLYLRGETGFGRETSVSAGIRQRFGPIEIKARTDGFWSVGAEFTTNF